jgi:glycosyltransferase involved in cell wall biosynthesis
MVPQLLLFALTRPLEAFRMVASASSIGLIVALRTVAEQSPRGRVLIYRAMRFTGLLLSTFGSPEGLVYTVVAVTGEGRRSEALERIDRVAQLSNGAALPHRAAAAKAAILIGDRGRWVNHVRAAGFSQPSTENEVDRAAAATALDVASAAVFAGEIGEGVRIMQRIAARPNFGRLARMRLTRRILSADRRISHYRPGWTPAIPTAATGATSPNPGRATMLWVNALPEIQSGYTLRSRSVAQALHGAGLEIEAVTAAGFPKWSPRLPRPVLRERGELTVWRIGGTGAGIDAGEISSHTARGLATIIDESGTGTIVATSPFLMAATSLAVARSRKIKAIYEVRGFLEETWASRAGEGAEGSELYRTWRAAEGRVMAESDAVVTLSDGMRDEIISRGVSAGSVHVVPNGVDVTKFTPRDADPNLKAQLGIPPETPVIGYIGSLVSYEGLPDLVRACAILRNRGAHFRLLIVGSGADMGRIQAAAHEANLGDLLVAPGRVPHAEVARYHALIDLFVVPRTAARVCQLVTPLKPYEAMAMGRCVVASDLAAMRQVVTDGITGRLAQPEDPLSLANVLGELLENPSAREALGAASREWVLRERTWEAIGARYAAIIRNLHRA